MKRFAIMACILLSCLVIQNLVFSGVGLAESNSSDTLKKITKSASNNKTKKAGKKQSSLGPAHGRGALKSELGTSFRFGADSLHGKYQNAVSTTATVENDKYLDDLLGAPKNFQGRAQQEAQRN